MKDYSKYKQCDNCGKYDMPDEDCVYERNGVRRYDYSMQCDGVMTMDIDPFALEINGDDTLYWDCQGSRHESAMDI